MGLSLVLALLGLLQARREEGAYDGTSRSAVRDLYTQSRKLFN